MELLFRQVTTDSVPLSWRALSNDDGHFRVRLRTGSRYQVEVSCGAHHVATAELWLPAASHDSSALVHNFYVRCQEAEPIIDKLPFLFFATNQATLRPPEVKRLQGVLRILHENPEVAMRLVGHADAQEGRPDQPDQAQYLQRLGQQRAQAAYKYLYQHGVPGHRLSTWSYGSQRPLTPDTIPNYSDYRPFNQRVEVEVRRMEPSSGARPQVKTRPSPLNKPAVPRSKSSTAPQATLPPRAPGRFKVMKHAMPKTQTPKAQK